MTEYLAMIYKNNRNKTYIANCMMNNIMGYGKTEEEAIENLKNSLKTLTGEFNIKIKSLYKLPLANNL